MYSVSCKSLSLSSVSLHPDDQPTANIDSPGSQPTTVLRTTQTRTINQPQTLTHLGHNQQQSSGLHKPGWSTNRKHWLTWVTTNNSPSQDYTNTDDQPNTNIDSPGSQPTTVLLRTTPTRTINQPQTFTHLGHNQQQSSGLHKPGWSTNHKHWLTWVTTNNSPSQDYTNPDDQPNTNIDSPWLTTNNSPSQDYTNPDDQPNTNIDSPWLTTNNSPSQDYTNPDDQPTTNIDSPGSQPTTVLRTTPTWTINQPQTLTHLGNNQQ